MIHLLFCLNLDFKFQFNLRKLLLKSKKYVLNTTMEPCLRSREDTHTHIKQSFWCPNICGIQIRQMALYGDRIESGNFEHLFNQYW